MWLLPLLVSTVVLFADHSSALRIVCYYRWLNRGLEPASFVVHQGRASARNLNEGVACTHIIVGFATVTSDYEMNITDVGGIKGLRRFVQEARATPSTKLMLSIGGGGGNNNFAQMAADVQNRETFLNSMSDIVQATGLDGIDYDWEFPTVNDRDAFVGLLRRSREVLDAISLLRRSSSKFQSISGVDLSVAVPGSVTLIPGFSPVVLNETCTFVNVMTYDLVLYQSWFPVATHHNSLFGQGGPLNILDLFSTKHAMNRWNKLGVSKDKLLLGLPTYGVAYELEDFTATELFSPVKGYSHLGSNLNFDTICEMRTSHPDHTHYDNRAAVPYLDDNNGTWVSNDDERSIAHKTTFAVENHYGGIMIFSLNADDPFGNCANSNGPFPLTRIAIATLRNATKSSSRLGRLQRAIRTRRLRP